MVNYLLPHFEQFCQSCDDILANRMLLLILVDLNHIGDFCLTKDSGNLKMGLNDTKQFLQM